MKTFLRSLLLTLLFVSSSQAATVAINLYLQNSGVGTGYYVGLYWRSASSPAGTTLWKGASPGTMNSGDNQTLSHTWDNSSGTIYVWVRYYTNSGQTGTWFAEGPISVSSPHTAGDTLYFDFQPGGAAPVHHTWYAKICYTASETARNGAEGVVLTKNGVQQSGFGMYVPAGETRCQTVALAQDESTNGYSFQKLTYDETWNNTLQRWEITNYRPDGTDIPATWQQDSAPPDAPSNGSNDGFNPSDPQKNPVTWPDAGADGAKEATLKNVGQLLYSAIKEETAVNAQGLAGIRSEVRQGWQTVNGTVGNVYTAVTAGNTKLDSIKTSTDAVKTSVDTLGGNTALIRDSSSNTLRQVTQSAAALNIVSNEVKTANTTAAGVSNLLSNVKGSVDLSNTKLDSGNSTLSSIKNDSSQILSETVVSRGKLATISDTMSGGTNLQGLANSKLDGLVSQGTGSTNQGNQLLFDGRAGTNILGQILADVRGGTNILGTKLQDILGALNGQGTNEWGVRSAVQSFHTDNTNLLGQLLVQRTNSNYGSNVASLAEMIPGTATNQALALSAGTTATADVQTEVGGVLGKIGNAPQIENLSAPDMTMSFMGDTIDLNPFAMFPTASNVARYGFAFALVIAFLYDVLKTFWKVVQSFNSAQTGGVPNLTVQGELLGTGIGGNFLGVGYAILIPAVLIALWIAALVVVFSYVSTGFTSYLSLTTFAGGLGAIGLYLLSSLFPLNLFLTLLFTRLVLGFTAAQTVVVASSASRFLFGR